MQVTNNNINTLSQGILLGSNFFLDLPYAYGDNVNNTFTNNQVTNCQISPLTLESALTVKMASNTFTDVMCNVFGELHPARVCQADSRTSHHMLQVHWQAGLWQVGHARTD